MTRLFLIALTLTTTLIGCNQEKKMEDRLFKEVMDVHDEVMPEMGTLRKLAKGIQLKLDASEADTLQLDPSIKKEMENAISELKNANNSMMEWMHQFEQIEEGTPHGEVMKYLLNQKKLIDKVKEDMQKAKNKGEYYLNL